MRAYDVLKCKTHGSYVKVLLYIIEEVPVVTHQGVKTWSKVISNRCMGPEYYIIRQIIVYLINPDCSVHMDLHYLSKAMYSFVSPSSQLDCLCSMSFFAPFRQGIN